MATVFAPNDTYIGDLLEELNKTAAELLGDKPLLRDILAYHVVPGEALVSEQARWDSVVA